MSHSSDVTIRRGSAADAARLSAFASRVFEETFGPMNTPENMRAYVARSFNVEQIKRELADEDSSVLVAHDGDVIAGYARIAGGETPADVRSERPIELVRLYVDAKFHGTAVAPGLMQACIDEAKERGYTSMYLGVWEHNDRAQRFYAKWGFTRVGEQRFDLGDDIQTDWIMERAV